MTDVSVRVAWGDDAGPIAARQVEAWQSSYVDLLPAELLDSLTVEELTPRWAASLARPGDARNRVLVALERVAVRGYAVTGPAGDPDADPVADGEVGELVVAPDHRGQGHGSRLLQACTDTLAADRFTRATWWVNAADDALRAFVGATGWEPDGAHRELDLTGDGSVRVRQVRLHVALA